MFSEVIRVSRNLDNNGRYKQADRLFKAAMDEERFIIQDEHERITNEIAALDDWGAPAYRHAFKPLGYVVEDENDIRTNGADHGWIYPDGEIRVSRNQHTEQVNRAFNKYYNVSGDGEPHPQYHNFVAHYASNIPEKSGMIRLYRSNNYMLLNGYGPLNQFQKKAIKEYYNLMNSKFNKVSMEWDWRYKGKIYSGWGLENLMVLSNTLENNISEEAQKRLQLIRSLRSQY